jgi:hypothetical protein
MAERVVPHEDVLAAADALRRVLDAVETGELAEGGPKGAALRRRLDGALLALEALVSEPSSSDGSVGT